MFYLIFTFRKCRKGNTALHYACSAGSISCAVALLNKGCDLREANNKGLIPLDHIPESKQGNLGKLLRKAGGFKLVLL